MMKLLKKNIELKNRAFTIAEAMFSIFISILVIMILQNLLVNLKTANKSNHRTDEIAYAYVQLSRFLKEDNDVVYTLPKSSNFKKAVFVKRTGHGKNKVEKTYILERYKNMIRSTTPDGGHMPLLLNVDNATFSTKDEQIKITVVEKDKRKSELYFKLDPRPKEEEKNEKDKSKAKKDENKKSEGKRSVK